MLRQGPDHDKRVVLSNFSRFKQRKINKGTPPHFAKISVAFYEASCFSPTGIGRTPIAKLFFSTGQRSRGGFWMRRQRHSSHSQRSLRLAHMATVWEGTRQEPSAEALVSPRSPRSAGIISRHNAKSSLCAAGPSEAGSRSKSPRRGAPGSLSHIKLATFAKFTHTVYGFSPGKQGGIWLCRYDESGRYCFGYRTWGYSPGRVTNEVRICDIVEWVTTRGY